MLKSKIISKIKKSQIYKMYELRLMWKTAESRKGLSDNDYAQLLHTSATGVTLNLDEPKTFDEKLWYLKFNNFNPLMTKCTDKHLAREYVKECGLAHILNEEYAVYSSCDEIDWDYVPDEAYFKCNHTSNCNIIFRRGEAFDLKWFNKLFSYTLAQNHFYLSREWNYKDIKPLIISERVLPFSDVDPILDYRFFCFSGEPKFITIDYGTASSDGTHGHHTCRNVYDLEFNQLDVTISRPIIEDFNVVAPSNLGQMIEYARILSKPFIHCRVDLYNIKGEIYFGEITFYHAGGLNNITPPEWDRKIGDWIDLSKLEGNND